MCNFIPVDVRSYWSDLVRTYPEAKGSDGVRYFDKAGNTELTDLRDLCSNFFQLRRLPTYKQNCTRFGKAAMDSLLSELCTTNVQAKVIKHKQAERDIALLDKMELEDLLTERDVEIARLQTDLADALALLNY